VATSKRFSRALEATSAATSSMVVPRLKSELLQIDLAGLDLGQVEDVVDDPEQNVARFLRGVDKLKLLFGQIAVTQQVEHAHDAIHRRADLMTHYGKELALGAVGGHCLIACFGQLLHLAFGLGQVTRDGGKHRISADDDFADCEVEREACSIAALALNLEGCIQRCL
jgi:hypothetical protein